MLKKYAARMSREEALRVLSLSEDYTAQDIKDSYRAIVRKYHPDTSPDPQAAEIMTQANLAREVLESSGEGTYTQEDNVREETFWDNYRARHSPKPTQSYSKGDLERLTSYLEEKGFTQMYIRVPVSYIPMDTWISKGPHGQQYNRPFGSAKNTQRIKDWEAFRNKFQSTNYDIFDIGYHQNEAWITYWIPSRREYISVSWEKPKSSPKKEPGVGMKENQVSEYLRSKGLAVVGGGSKYTYWSMPNTPKRSSAHYYIRLGTKTINLASYHTKELGSGEFSVGEGIYYGKVTTKILDGLIRAVQKPRARV